MYKNYKAIIFPLKTEAAAIRKMIQDIVKLNRSFVLYPVSVFLCDSLSLYCSYYVRKSNFLIISSVKAAICQTYITRSKIRFPL